MLAVVLPTAQNFALSCELYAVSSTTGEPKKTEIYPILLHAIVERTNVETDVQNGSTTCMCVNACRSGVHCTISTDQGQDL